MWILRCMLYCFIFDHVIMRHDCIVTPLAINNSVVHIDVMHEISVNITGHWDIHHPPVPSQRSSYAELSSWFLLAWESCLASSRVAHELRHKRHVMKLRIIGPLWGDSPPGSNDAESVFMSWRVHACSRLQTIMLLLCSSYPLSYVYKKCRRSCQISIISRTSSQCQKAPSHYLNQCCNIVN